MTEERDSGQEASGVKHPGGGLGYRHVQALLLFSLFFTVFLLRLNLSVAIVSMTDANSSNPDFPEYNWTGQEKAYVLSSFFWGYLVVQLPAGLLGQVVSPRLLLLVSTLICSVLAALTPVASSWGGPPLLAALRLAQGLAQGFVTPLSYNLASKWAPPHERNRFVGFSLNGGTLGATAAYPVCGLLAASDGGWPSIFYTSAALGLLWTICWALLGADSPQSHPFISQKEVEYITSSLPHTSYAKKPKTPWKAILTSVPVWAVIFAHIGNGWGFALIITQLPTYINSVLKFDISSNGLVSALPYLSMWVLTFPVCWLADFLSKKQCLSQLAIRNLWTTISQGGGALCMIALCYAGNDPVAVISLLTLTVSLSAFLFAGFNINHLDLAPNFAGVLMGLTNGLENITTILAPLSVGWIVTDPGSVEQWRIVFFLTASVTFIGNLLFVVFSSASVQPWNTLPDQEKEITTPNNLELAQ